MRAPSAIGLRVKSGWASAVLVVGPAAHPRVVDARRVELADPDVAATKQPYHASSGKEETNEKKIRERLAIIRRATKSATRDLLGAYADAGFAPKRATLVVGSLTDPMTIHHPHMRAHALEGRIFPTILGEALAAAGVRSRAVAEKEICAVAAAALRRAPAELKRAAAQMGRGQAGGWRAEEKLATAGAWMAMGRF